MLNKYDALFIFDQTMDEESLKQAMERVGQEVARFQGAITDSTILGKRPFARPIKKREGGNYVRASVQLEPDSVQPLQARLKLNDEVIRVQITRVDTRQIKEEPAAAPVAEEKADAES